MSRAAPPRSPIGVIVRVLVALALVASAFLVPAAGASAHGGSAQVVLDWNAHAIAAIFNAPTAPVPGSGLPPPPGSLHLAMVQGAVYDAVNAIDRTHKPYLRGLPKVSKKASKDAAAATAAHDVLVGLQPPLAQVIKDRLDGLYADTLALIKDGKRKDQGIAIGQAAAAKMLKKRAHDGRFVPYAFPVGTDPGDWRLTPPGFVNDPFAWVANVRPFTLKRASQVRTRGPLPLTSEKYAAEFNEVKAFGSATSAVRTPEQTAMALFFSINPIPMYHVAFRQIAVDRHLSASAAARMLATLDLAGADSLIGCWDDKDRYHFWRPSTAIQLADIDDNPATVADPNWKPLINDPPYPDHPSGFNCYTGATMYAARDFFGKDRIPFVLHNPVSNTDRAYTRFTDVPKDTIEARMLLGIHFRTPDVQGVKLGKKVADWVDDHFFGRAKKHRH
jgi:hypothetical protein